MLIFFLLQFKLIFQGKVKSAEAKDRVLALRLLSVLADTAGAQMMQNLEVCEERGTGCPIGLDTFCLVTY